MNMSEFDGVDPDTFDTEVEIVPLDEPSIEDYPLVDTLIEADEFGAPPVKVVPVRDGVRDTEDRSMRRRA